MAPQTQEANCFFMELSEVPTLQTGQDENQQTLPGALENYNQANLYSRHSNLSISVSLHHVSLPV